MAKRRACPKSTAGQDSAAGSGSAAPAFDASAALLQDAGCAPDSPGGTPFRGRSMEGETSLTHPRSSPAEEAEAAAMVAHDVRNLLAQAHMHAELRLADLGAAPPPAGGSELADSLRAIRRSVAQAVTLCAELLAAAGGRPAPMQPVDLEQVVHSAAALFRARAGKAARLQLAGAGERVIVHGRRMEIERALLNLLWNALEAMEESGVAEPRADLSWGRGHDGPWLQVRDHGPGLSSASLAELAQPFRTTREEDGRVRGLGLASVHRILRAHGGALEAEPPASGPGTVMRMRFGVQRELDFGG